MYSNRENTLPENVLRIEVDTTDPVDAESALEWALSVISFLRTVELADGEPDIEVRHLGYGSTALELAFLGLAAVAGVGLFAVKVQEALESGDAEVASATREFADNFGGRQVTISCVDRDPIVIRIDAIPARSFSPFGRGRYGEGAFGGDPPGGDSASPVVTEDDEFELQGRIVTTHGGRFAVFRTGRSEYVVARPLDLMETVPIGEDIVVRASMLDGQSNNIVIHDWQFARDKHVNWANEEGLPGVQAQKLEAIERRNEWGSEAETKGDASYRQRVPSIAGHYPRPSELKPPLDDDLRPIDAADARTRRSLTLVGRFSEDAGGVVYFGTDQVYGPVSNPNAAFAVGSVVVADVEIENAVSENKVLFVIRGAREMDSF